MKVSMRLQRSILRGIFAALATLACAPLAQAADFYVAMPAPDGIGDDSNSGTSAAPFATIGAAITAAGGSAATIYIADGEYTLSAALTLAAPIVIIGNTTNPDQVIINNNSAQHLAFSITDASAAIKGVKITGTGTKGGNGGHISMTAGLLEDCIIFNGGGKSANFKGGNVYMTGGRLRRCWIIDGKSTWNQWSGFGGNIYASGGVVENCLIKGGDGGHGSGIYADGAVNVVNCTFVGQKQTVTAGGEAVYANNSNARIVNCAIYGNGGTPQYEWGNKNASCFINCAVAASAASGFTGTGCTATLTAGDFVDYDGGDYHSSASVNLMDKGVDPSSYASDLSSTDLDGQPRFSPDDGTIDIGCYEYQQTGVVLMGSILPKRHFQGDPVTCVASQMGASGSVVFKWDFDDGTPVITSEDSIPYTYTRIGIHTNTLYLSTDGGITWCATNALEAYVSTVVPTNIYVKETNDGAAYPYDSDATATTNIVDACALACLATDQGRGTVCTVHVADGNYTLAADIPLVNPTVIVGNTTNPDQVIINNNSAQHLAFSITDASAAIKGVTITGTGTKGGNGGHINMTDGLIEDCVITNGGGSIANFYGGNVYMTGGRLRRCVIADGKSTYTEWSGHGGNIYATGGVVENCLIKGGDGGRGSGVYANGAVKVVNCTFVGQKHHVAAGGEAVYANNANARIVNCAFYDNGGTAQYEWGNANAGCFTNCAFSVDAAYSGTASTVLNLTADDFKDYANGDYHPAKNGVLVNAGTKWDAYLGYGATSEKDLAGAARLSGKFLDIGCYEIASSVGLSIFVR